MIADLKSRSVSDIDPFLIDQSDLVDRIPTEDDEDHAALMESIRQHGQQVPVLLRPHPEQEGRFQVVYGRRRILALRDLGMPVKAMVRQIDDTSALIAQGTENSARKNLSFIEKANFARQMQQAGYKRDVMCDALNVDKTVISRMLNVIEDLPQELIMAIGPAPAAGRDRWSKLAGFVNELGFATDVTINLMGLTAAGEGSDARFDGLFKTLEDRIKARQEAAPKPRAKPTPLVGSGGGAIGKMRATKSTTTFVLSHAKSAGFETWLAENMTKLHQNWKYQQGE